MPGEENNNNPTADAGREHAETVLFGKDTEGPDEGYDSGTETAPGATNPEVKAPEVKEPDPKAVVEGEPVDANAEAKKTAEAKDVKPEAKAEESDEDKELRRLEEEAIGVKVEPESDPVWKQRYEDACSHITRLEGDLNTKLDYLKSVGLEIVKTKDGFGLAPTQEYKEKLDLSDIAPDQIFKQLTEQERELFELDPAKACKVIAEKVALEIAAKRPAATVQRTEKVLSAHETDEVFTAFSQEKREDGKTLKYPDAEDPRVTALMAKAFQAQTPGMEALRTLMSRDKEAHKVGLEFLWLKAFHARQYAKAMLADVKAQKEAKLKENKKGPTVSTPGSNVPVKGQQAGGSAGDISSRLLDFVAGSSEEPAYR